VIASHVRQDLTELITALAQKWDVAHVNAPMNAIHSRAKKLVSPVIDYQAAAIEGGWEKRLVGDFEVWRNRFFDDGSQYQAANPRSLRNLCEDHGIKPHQYAVTQLLAVSGALAKKLVLNGERVDIDFYGFNIWARYSYGLVEADPVLAAIIRENVARPHIPL
jgi:hypothetical protein